MGYLNLFRAVRDRVRFARSSYVDRLAWDALPDPYYGYCLYHAASEAVQIGYDRISVMEFGVASGLGLLSIEWHARHIREILPIEIEIYGFDLGDGLPPASDPRDLPYLWFEGDFRMDLEALLERLASAELVLGDVAETTSTFFTDRDASPLACAFFDLDYYSSTLAAFNIFNAGADHVLPRVACYFDDVIGRLGFPLNEHVGVLAAIAEFNARSETRKIGKINCLHRKRRRPARWNDKIYIYQNFEHPRYALPIRSAQPWKRSLVPRPDQEAEPHAPRSVANSNR